MEARTKDWGRGCGAAVVVLAGLVGAAGESAARVGAERRMVGQPVVWSTYEQGLVGVWSRATVVVARSAAEWDSAMAELSRGGGLLVEPAPCGEDLGVDWEQEALVLVTLGEQPAARWQLKVHEVRRHGSRLLLDSHLELADPNLVMATAPYHMVVVRKCGWTEVEALYDAVGGAAGKGKGATPALGSGAAGVAEAAAAAAPAARPETWSALRARYR